ncbi:hypothetical protein TREMEDRAFT_73645 [Tremella mesenterica DSM 1558]|uniref:uncharacterized protein n=1 Tax=Tremella mesenterica (strain ATCC 24925 / CBS 8224 / DSM 1558 / NBRC 9311 / NRRL Y-6157 / RJB 2259-6 / UBC 559-6) TaxID=578456 RepID=UPI0003F48E3C|nr:uncharacterized protein TREMEDRAFT_73645 [Tremella mesenterica DSM 1558]EIW69882.1 hypothetical protein TREMEDRAFT_73645 [Tremella mesenterica DSM 1558]
MAENIIPVPPVAQPSGHPPSHPPPKLYILDYGAGNVRSLANSIKKLGYEFEWIRDISDFDKAEKLIFPGVGAFGQATTSLRTSGYDEPLGRYISSGRPYFGICIGMQMLFTTSTESPGAEALGVIPFPISRFTSDLLTSIDEAATSRRTAHSSSLSNGTSLLNDKSDADPSGEEKGMGGVEWKGEEKGKRKAVPHMGWNKAWKAWQDEDSTSNTKEETLMLDEDYYFVHSYGAMLKTPEDEEIMKPYAYTLSRYGDEVFVSSVKVGNVFGTQFHPEKSGPAGLDLLRRWLSIPSSTLTSPPLISFLPSSSSLNSHITTNYNSNSQQTNYQTISTHNENTSTNPDMLKLLPKGKWQNTDPHPRPGTGLTSRIVACLDVRSNDSGDLVVTKGDQYDVRDSSSKHVRNLGLPVSLSQRYYQSGADEICFLNITSFRSSALRDQPMLDVVRSAAETVFVPLTVGGGIRDTIDPDGTKRSALEVAGIYFRSGADKVSIGSDAVSSVKELLQREKQGIDGLTGKTSIETIAKAYGSQAVVVSVDPRRVYVDTNDSNWMDNFPKEHLDCLVFGDKAKSNTKNEEKEKVWWYACTIAGGRETTDLDVIQLVKGVEKLGAGEILLNSVDRDGSGKGFDLDLINLVKKNVGIPVVSSSGAGSSEDFVQVFKETGTEAALAAGIFHREEVGIDEVKEALEKQGVAVRRIEMGQ